MLFVNKAPYSIKSAPYSNIEPYIPSKEPYIPSKEPYIPSKEPYIPSKEPYIPSKEPYILSKEPLSVSKSAAYSVSSAQSLRAVALHEGVCCCYSILHCMWSICTYRGSPVGPPSIWGVCNMGPFVAATGYCSARDLYVYTVQGKPSGADRHFSESCARWVRFDRDIIIYIRAGEPTWCWYSYIHTGEAQWCW